MASPLVIALLLTAAVVAVAIAGRPPVGLDPKASDAPHYIKLAEGRAAEVPSPFSARFLEPLVVRGLVASGRVSLPVGFAILAACGCLLLSWILGRFALAEFARPALVALAILTPGMMDYYRGGFAPEVLHAGGLALFLFLLARRNWIAAVALIPVLYCIREATVLLVLVAAVVAWRMHLRKLAAAVVVAGVVGAVVSARVVAAAHGNIHQMSPLAYMVGKVGYNIPKNVFGITFWTNTFDSELHEAPIWRADLPRALRVGGMTQVGLEPYNPRWPAQTAEAWLTAFGAAPVVGWFLWRRGRRQDPKSQSSGTPRSSPPYWFALAAAYGVVSFVIAPGLGAAVGRIVTYGWPVFWLVVPIALSRRYQLTAPVVRKLAFAHLAIAWLPRVTWPAFAALFGAGTTAGYWTAILTTIVIAVLIDVYVWRLLRTLVPARPMPKYWDGDPSPTPTLAGAAT